MNSRYTPDAQAWLDEVRRVELAVSGVLVDRMNPVKAIELARTMAPDLVGELAANQSAGRKSARALISKSASPNVVRAAWSQGMAFCPDRQQAVRLKNERRMHMSGLVGTCPLCSQIHYREN